MARRSVTVPQRGHVRKRGGSYQILVYSGTDPVTGKDVYLSESTTDEDKVAAIQTRLQAKVDKQRSAATRATLEYAINAWLEVHEAEESTIDRYREVVRTHIVPALGAQPISKIGPQMLERFYAHLRRCRARCNGKPFIEHRQPGDHECRTIKHRRPPGRPSARSIADHNCETANCTVVECQPHACNPLAVATVLKVHAVISGALGAATRWEWIDSNPADEVKKGKQKPAEPKPPTPAEAARILDQAWSEEHSWGMLLWLKMITGARRGELLALRWSDLQLDEGIVEIRRSYTQRSGKKREKDTKSHQMRRNNVDDMTVDLLEEHKRRCTELLKQLGSDLDPTSFVFSYEPDHSRPCNPDGISHRYALMCERLGIESHLHTLRHYTATELINAGVDIRSVAGRIGHGGGGATTLRVYSAWINETDRQSANLLADRLTRPPATPRRSRDAAKDDASQQG